MRKIKLSAAWFSEREIEAVARVMKRGSVSMGQETLQFERELLSFFGRPESHVICVQSCTAAIQLSVQAYGIGLGADVLVPTLTFVSTFQAVKACGATPIPCDVNPSDGVIDLDDAARRITTNTKAILPVIYAGCDSRVSDIYEFARRYGIRVIEDVAHCFGNDDVAQRDGLLCFSFDPIKNISCGDGGCILTADSAIASRLQDMRLLGVIGDTEKRYNGQRSWDFDVVEQGWRLHMNDIAAAIGRAQLSRFQQIKEKRQNNARMYINAFVGLDGLQLFPVDTKTSVPHIFPVIVKNGLRDSLKEFLAEHGVETGIQYKPNHLLSYFNLGYDLPNAMGLYRNMLSLPVHPLLSEDDVRYVINSVLRFFKQ
ncbi:MAG: DegT/DnrJ/EryC1/StrS family aminotransferase [Holosporales bacterium]|jgi:dTDP-4-amino-4,6-dideoxygalactose transaminase|nr:DegT/DnrJ/EryC1/StrS family aminotransferase [Holosporales bacterium]